MRTADFQIEDARGDATVLKLTGDWTTMGLGKAAIRLGDHLQGVSIEHVDLSELGKFDTAGALALVQASNFAMPEGAFEARPEAGRIYAMVETLERQSAEPPKRPASWVRIFSKIGHGVHDAAAEFLLSMAFLGRLMGATSNAFRHPGAIRWPAWVSQADRAGLDALPIVAVTNFFIGAVIAFLGANLLTQFGAGVFTVQLVAVAVLRELAVLITAILLAGRSASSFAAEIGQVHACVRETEKGDDEIRAPRSEGMLGALEHRIVILAYHGDRQRGGDARNCRVHPRMKHAVPQDQRKEQERP